MIPQIDEKQVAVVALAVQPSRQTDGLADMVWAQLAASVAAVGIHE